MPTPFIATKVGECRHCPSGVVHLSAENHCAECHAEFVAWQQEPPEWDGEGGCPECFQRTGENVSRRTCRHAAEYFR
jgi:hypothetical protein